VFVIFLRLFHFAAAGNRAPRHAPCLPTKAAGILGRIPRPEIVNNSRFFTEECGGGRLPSPLHCLLRRPALCVCVLRPHSARFNLFIGAYVYLHLHARQRACKAGAKWTTIIITDYYGCKRPALSPLETSLFICIIRAYVIV
jgi:hypothetical protein